MLHRVLLALVLIWGGLVFYMWSPQPYWPDADGYLLHVAEGRWVAHPPGYALFVILGRLFHAVGFGPYMAVQLASLSLTVAGLVVLHRLLRQFLEPARAAALTVAAAFSWAVLLNAQTGTSHAADLFTVSLILLAAVRLPGETARSAWPQDLLFGLSLFLCAGFRPAALIMLLPLCLLVAWNNRRRASFWISCVAAALVIAIWQSWVVWQSGGYAIYSATVAGMNEGNARSSLLVNGLTETSILNILRALLWVSLAVLPFSVVVLANSRQWNTNPSQPALLYGLAAWLLPLVAVALYLCTHPGFAVTAVRRGSDDGSDSGRIGQSVPVEDVRPGRGVALGVDSHRFANHASGPKMASRGQWSFAAVFGGLLTPRGLQHHGPLATPWRFGARTAGSPGEGFTDRGRMA